MPNNEGFTEYVEKITNGVMSASGSDKDLFCEAMSREHRTHQQAFTRLCVVWLAHVGQNGYQTDLRNQASHDVGKQFIEAVRNGDIDPYLPII